MLYFIRVNLPVLEILDLGICPVSEDSIKFVMLTTFKSADGKTGQVQHAR